MSRPTKRPPVERRQTSHARTAARRLATAKRKAAEATRAVEAAEATLRRIHASTEARLGVSVPNDPDLLDVLAMIDVRPGNAWHWTGLRNNHGTAVLRLERGEKSVVRYLALRLGMIEADEHGLLYPMCDTEDVNPWHRTLRNSGKPLGRRDPGPWPKSEAS